MSWTRSKSSGAVPQVLARPAARRPAARGTCRGENAGDLDQVGPALELPDARHPHREVVVVDVEARQLVQRHPLVEHRVGLAAEDLDVVAEVDERLGEVAGVDALAADVGLAPVGEVGDAQRAVVRMHEVPASHGPDRAVKPALTSCQQRDSRSADGRRIADGERGTSVARPCGPSCSGSARAAVDVDGERRRRDRARPVRPRRRHPRRRRGGGAKLADKLGHLRVFADDAGAMNRSVAEAGGEILVVSQFTLYGDTARAGARRGSPPPGPSRPSRWSTRSSASCGASASRWRPAASAPTWRSSSSTTAR